MEKIAQDYDKTMELIKQTIESYTTKPKRDLFMYLDAVKTSLAFTIKVTKQIMKGQK